MDTCFVIQPFDKGTFEKRYQDVIAPSIRAAGLEPYRVDQDPAAEILIEDIENGIRHARICLAEITTNNPNIWYELGFALASAKNVVLICSEERTERFPFDVQHRKIIEYKTESSSDFETLGNKIVERIRAYLKKEDQYQMLSEGSPVAATEGLAQHEIALLATIMQHQLNPSDTVYSGFVQGSMAKAGYTDIATSLAVRTLLKKKLISTTVESDFNDNKVTLFQVTQAGEDWLQDNMDLLVIKRDPSNQAKVIEDDIPF
jgi:hypothetical protein